jgi:hypothetical protein
LIPHHCPNLVPTSHELKIVNGTIFFGYNDKENVVYKKTKTYKVNVTYEMAEPQFQYSDVYPSLADWWSEWILTYVGNDDDSLSSASTSSPRLLIRFEDMLFHAEYVMAQIIECAYGSINSTASSSSSWSSLLKPYDYKLTKAKTHGRSTDFIGAIMKYARQDTKRSGGMTPQDLAFARGDYNDSNSRNDSSSNNNSSGNSSTAPLHPKLMQMFSYTHPPANTSFRIQYRLMNVPS